MNLSLALSYNYLSFYYIVIIILHTFFCFIYFLDKSYQRIIHFLILFKEPF